MTKKDFILIANAIHTLPLGDGWATARTDATREKIARHFAGELATTNGRFDSERFVDACTNG